MSATDKTNNLFPDISIDNPQVDFAKFLERRGNKRIFFSAEYGTGKTYFLQKFFEKEKNKKEYDVYHLFPVRYQVSSNEDIIRLLKCDVFAELCVKYPNALKKRAKGSKRNKVDKLIKNICTEDIYNLAASAGNMLSLFAGFPPPGVLGRTIDGFKHVKSFIRALDSIYRGHNKLDASTYGYIPETKDISAPDKFSDLLQKLISKFKSGKKSVLILDDLDRIDPEHILRLLNIFSAHDLTNEDNELRFDHVIIVGCMDNIKGIYQHRYGINAEFDGYFDKFYSTTPYIFDNKKAVAASIQFLIESLLGSNKSVRSEDKLFLQWFLHIYIHESLDMKTIRLRHIYKRISDIDQPISRNISIPYLHINRAINVYKSFFPNYKLFLVNLEEIANKNKLDDSEINNINYVRHIVGDMLNRMDYRRDRTNAPEIQEGISKYGIEFEMRQVRNITKYPLAAMSYFMRLYCARGLHEKD